MSKMNQVICSLVLGFIILHTQYRFGPSVITVNCARVETIVDLGEVRAIYTANTTYQVIETTKQIIDACKK